MHYRGRVTMSFLSIGMLRDKMAFENGCRNNALIERRGTVMMMMLSFTLTPSPKQYAGYHNYISLLEPYDSLSWPNYYSYY
jgi:hypothetical protein